MKYVCVLASLLSCCGLILAQDTLRLTDNPSDMPCIVVSAQGTHVAWMEAREEPSPVNKTFWIITYDIASQVTTEVLRVPGIQSNQPMQLLVGDKSQIKGPNFKDTDLNYRIVGDATQMRLSGDGRYLVTCVEERYNYTLRTPFFVLIDLQEKTVVVIPVQVPDGLGSLVGVQITSRMDTLSWDFNPAGTHLAYVLDAVNYRGSTVVLYDIKEKTSRRVLGYEKAAYVNGTLTLDGPTDQFKLYGKHLQVGQNTLVISGKNSQGREGVWITNLSQGTSVWHEASYANPGVAGDHVFYSSQKPAVWLNPDGTEAVVFEQRFGINNQVTLPFWSGTGTAYVTDQAGGAVLQLGETDPVPVVTKADLGVPEVWQFRFRGSSSSDSFRLVSDAGGTLVLPVCDPRESRKFDLFLMTRDVPQAVAAVDEVEAEAESEVFNSLVDAFGVGPLLKPGELPRQFMPDDMPASGPVMPPLPPAWDTAAFSTPEPMVLSLSDTAEAAHAEAQMELMLGTLDNATLSTIIDRLETAVDLAPTNRQYRLDLADAYVAANTTLSIGAAIEQYGLLLKDNKKDDDALAGLADAYLQLGNGDQALEIVYLRSVQNPENLEIRHSAALQMAVFTVETGDRVGCLTWLRLMYEQHPEDSFVAGLIGLLWQLDGDSQRAEAIFDKVLKESPPDDPVRDYIGQIKQALAERRTQS
ncbi:MAG: tetratricopeptide repeat protein [Phycisphaerae bacterium]|nr:tetratricopeptide repeat protein [Phycisphaerae bacterium]